jgi:1,4-dihydroxy-2-naphthoate octaprenyltransferase
VLLYVSVACLFGRAGSRLFFAWLRGLARLCTYVSSLLSVVSGALSFTVSITTHLQGNQTVQHSSKLPLCSSRLSAASMACVSHTPSKLRTLFL